MSDQVTAGSDQSPKPYDRFGVTHRLVCNTCGHETSVALGEINPIVVDLFMSHHPSPPHLVRDERVGVDGKAEIDGDEHA